MTWLSLLCPSCRPNDLRTWLSSLYNNCLEPKGVELSLTLEEPLDEIEYKRWGRVFVTMVKHGQYNINQLTEICYKQSNSPYIFLSGDDTICRTHGWDGIFRTELDKYKDNVVLLYPNDTIFGANLACYPVTSRLVMNSVLWPVPYERYCVDDTIFDIVPSERRFYLEQVVMEHLHLSENPPGHPIMKNGKQYYYPHDVESMQRDRKLFGELASERALIRKQLRSLYAKTNTKIIVGVPTAEYARRADFYDYYNMLEKPEGTICTFSHGQSPARNRNLIIQQALEHDCTHVFFLDDDVAFRPDLLTKLLSHDKDIVTGLYLMRNYPHRPIVFDYSDNEGKCKHTTLNGQRGLIEIVNCGLGCCLIKTEVFRAMEKPWIRLGELEKDHWCDDISFFNRARAAGFKLYCDLTCLVGHFASVTVWPNMINNDWHVTYDTQGTGQVSFKVVE